MGSTRICHRMRLLGSISFGRLYRVVLGTLTTKQLHSLKVGIRILEEGDGTWLKQHCQRSPHCETNITYIRRAPSRPSDHVVGPRSHCRGSTCKVDIRLRKNIADE
jgi:hypothetical protein